MIEDLKKHIDGYIDEKTKELSTKLQGANEDEGAKRRQRKKEDKARFRKIQERLNSWVDQIELRVNEIDRRFRSEIRKFESTNERNVERSKSREMRGGAPPMVLKSCSGNMDY
jgi:hypothetical protein